MKIPHFEFPLVRGVIAALFLSTVLFAAAAEPGTVSGRIANAATGAFLQGAEVSIVGLPARALSDRDGSFTLPGIPTGPHTLRVYYTGLEVVTQPVDVRAGQTTPI